MDNKSPHILTTASNLLGFSFLVLSSIKTFNLPQGGLLDEILASVIVILAISCVFSFVSIRTTNESRSKKSETYADYMFLAALIFITISSVLLGLDFILFIK